MQKGFKLPITFDTDPGFYAEHYEWVRCLAARTFRGNSATVDIDDLTQVGLTALYRAKELYTDDGTATFKTYAHTRVLGEMLSEMARQDLVSKHTRHVFKEIHRVAQLFWKEEQRHPTVEEVAANCRYNEKQLMRVYQTEGNLRLHGIKKEDPRVQVSYSDYRTLGEYDLELYYNEYTALPDQEYEDKEIAELLQKGLATLEETERNMLQDRFYEDISQPQQAKKYDMTLPQVIYIQQQAIKKLREFVCPQLT